MQVFVRRSALSSTTEPINVIATYEDNITVDPKWHGDDMVVLSLPSSVIDSSKNTLTSDWRNAGKQQVVFSEAARRILEVFPEYSQRNANNEVASYITAHGADSSKWPNVARNRKAEIDRCWTYVEAVRSTSNRLAATAAPIDPTGDGNWPTRIAPYVPT